MADRMTKIVLRGDVRGLQSSMAVANRSMQTLRGEIRQVNSESARAKGQLSGLLKVAAGSAAVVGLGRLVKESVQLEAAYSKTMAQVAVATQAPASALERLDDLAMKLGADTVFSAQDAASAMLQLAKGGLSTAEIEAGALADTLTLASAGELELGRAADVVVQAMGAFRLQANQTDEAVAALAGGANASSASVDDMTQALAQAGTTANSVDLSIQDTTAYLALFADQGIKGSDAGTGFRTMLSRLVPQTKSARDAMDALGLSYTDANGEIVSAEEIASRTQKAFKDLSDDQRIAAVNAIFGADAQRAVNAITAEGVEGFREYKEATSDLTQAQKLAEAANSGTAGALEQMSGAIETAKIQLGKGLAPVLQDVAGEIANLVEDGDLEGWAEGAGQYIQSLVDDLRPLVSSGYELGREALPVVAEAGGVVIDVLRLAADVITPLVDGFNSLPDAAQQAVILAVGAQQVGKRIGVLPGLSDAAGTSLLAFGTNAEKSGDKAKNASGKYAALATNVKGAGLLLAAGIAIPEFGSQASDILDSIGVLRDKSSDLAKTLSSDGTATADTLEIIGERLNSGALGKHAEKAGINLDRLAKSLTASGKEGEYARETLDKLQQTFEAGNFMDEASSTASSILPFLETDEQRAEQMSSALRDLMNEYDRASAKARENTERQRLSANAFLIEAAGLERYKSELMDLPTAVITKILTPGAIDSAKDVERLVRRYKLTPDLVRTIVELSGADVSAEQMRRILNLADRIDRAKPKADVKVVTEAAQIGLGNVIGLLNRVTDRTATVTVRQNIERSYTTAPGPSSKNLLDMLTDPAGRAKGGPIGRAAGGPISGPGTRTSDSIPAIGPRGTRYRLSDGEHVWTADEVDAAGGHEAMYAMRDAVLAQRNAMANGGSVGTSITRPAGPTTVTADVSGARVAFDPDGVLRFVDTRITLHLDNEAQYRDRDQRAGRGNR